VTDPRQAEVFSFAGVLRGSRGPGRGGDVAQSGEGRYHHPLRHPLRSQDGVERAGRPGGSQEGAGAQARNSREEMRIEDHSAEPQTDHPRGRC